MFKHACRLCHSGFESELQEDLYDDPQCTKLDSALTLIENLMHDVLPEGPLSRIQARLRNVRQAVLDRLPSGTGVPCSALRGLSEEQFAEEIAQGKKREEKAVVAAAVELLQVGGLVRKKPRKNVSMWTDALLQQYLLSCQSTEQFAAAHEGTESGLLQAAHRYRMRNYPSTYTCICGQFVTNSLYRGFCSGKCRHQHWLNLLRSSQFQFRLASEIQPGICALCGQPTASPQIPFCGFQCEYTWQCAASMYSTEALSIVKRCLPAALFTNARPYLKQQGVSAGNYGMSVLRFERLRRYGVSVSCAICGEQIPVARGHSVTCGTPHSQMLNQRRVVAFKNHPVGPVPWNQDSDICLHCGKSIKPGLLPFCSRLCEDEWVWWAKRVAPEVTEVSRILDGTTKSLAEIVKG